MGQGDGLDQARRIYELMMLTGFADGHLHAEEAGAARRFVELIPELHGLSELDALERSARARLDRAGLKQALAEVASGLADREHRELAFMCCARVLEADGAVAHGEFVVLSQLRLLLGLGADDVARLLSAAGAGDRG